MSYAVFVRFALIAAGREVFNTLVRENARISRETEPGCLRFDVLTDPDRPDEISLYELYTDSDAFAAHCRAPHFLEFDAATRSIVAAKEVATWRSVEPDPTVVATDKRSAF